MATRTAPLTAGSVAGYFSGIRDELTRIRTNLMAEVSDSMGRAIEHGQEVARERIELSTTPTGDRRAAAGAGFPGRIETGAMEDGFQVEHYQVNPDRMQARVGWLDGGEKAHGEDKSYIQLQDEGFQGVAGVHALLDAMEVAKADFKKDITQYVRNEFS
jgi:hypothetical protein